MIGIIHTKEPQNFKDFFSDVQKQIGLTQREIADNLGISVRSYKSLIAGKKQLTLQEANVINALYDLPFEIQAKWDFDALKAIE
jgi:plasmid maintenance system antidote protein VapI